jgi:hypothetical protein
MQCGQISGDAYHYFMEIASDTNQVLDGYQDRGEFDRHWNRLIDMGLYMEEHYLNWRHSKPSNAPHASFMGLRAIPFAISEFLRDSASHIVDDGFESVCPESLAKIDQRFGFHNTVQVMRRSLRRAEADLGNYSAQDMRGLQAEIDAEREARRLDLRDKMREIMRQNGRGDNDVEWRDIQASNTYDTKLARQFLKNAEQKNRGIIKRSIKFMSRLAGADTTRIFLSGQVIRFEGEHAIYELKKTSGVLNSHGGAKLSLFTKDTDLHLCDICIYTPNVPLLDHVASIILHVRTGHESDILDIGNPYNCSEEAHKQDWLVPYLPKKLSLNLDDGTIGGRAMFGLPPLVPNRQAKKEIVVRQLGRYLYDEVLDGHQDLIRRSMTTLTPIMQNQYIDLREI